MVSRAQGFEKRLSYMGSKMEIPFAIYVHLKFSISKYQMLPKNVLFAVLKNEL